jgi:DNA-binding transcriptional MerR regulator
MANPGNAAVGRENARPAGISIGAVLALLRPEFPDVSISKIRFLEDQGLVEPERTPSGYRKFDHQDVERLRYVLGVQRDHYLPLRVIRDHLDALDAGVESPVVRGGPGSPRLVPPPEEPPPPRGEKRLSRQQLLHAAEIDEPVLADLESHGLVTPRTGSRTSAPTYDGDALLIARTAGELAGFGIEPRHLRAFRSAADREAGLVEQVVSPLRRGRGAEAAARAEEATREVSGLCVRLHAALVKAALDRGGA